MSKRPESVLVVIHTPTLDILLLERSAHAGYWQSVTGSREPAEALIETAIREVAEETGLDIRGRPLRAWNLANRFEIFAEWRHRYAAGVTHNVEYVFSVELQAPQAVTLAPGEHLAWVWLPWNIAAARVFSWTNRDAILALASERGLLAAEPGIS